MRVAQVNDIAFVGSAMVRALRTCGVDAELVEPIRPGAGIAYPWKVVTLPLRAAGLLAAGARLRGGRFDLVHVHYARLGMLGPLSGRPYVLHCHGTDIRGIGRASAWGREVEPFLRRAALVYYATPDLRPWVTAFRPDATFLPNPIDLPTSAGGAGPPVVDLLVGVRLDPVKGVDAISATVAGILERRPSTTVTIVDQGAGVGLVRAAAADRARMVAPVRHSDMARLFGDHRLAIGQMRVGAVGNYELEAMAAALPVAAAFRFGEAYETPPPVVTADGPEALADRIVALLDDESARLAIGDAGRRWIAATHAPGAVAARLVADYRRILRR